MRHLLLSLIFVVPCLAAADDDKKASDEGRRNNRAAEAHRTLFESTDRGRESAHFTEAVMRDLPATAPGTDVPRQGFIDRILFRQMAERGIPHAGLASDTEYIRRVYLDAIGLPPEPDAVRAFVAGDAPQKRVELIDSLIGTEAFAEQWAWFWGDLFRLASQVGPVKNSFQFWVKEWLQVDQPYDEVVHDLLTGVSKAHGTIPSLAFLSRSHQAKSRIVMSNEDYGILNRLDSIDQFNVDTSRIFLGITTSCISCHDGHDHLDRGDASHTPGVGRGGRRSWCGLGHVEQVLVARDQGIGFTHHRRGEHPGIVVVAKTDPSVGNLAKVFEVE